ncbi:hypothetical protein Ga0609869_000593 [Rhodovulum iodosum]|uniref:Right-handed parallel beta-helix repeat-containing protein n=1 Tax=Rhodovulum iodosum TaxID=68291 RepID=A0ABV3XR20_9RHOB|nr:hypothetical protein [Rhodovulum robiginosum]RSK31467.1 hypothetical protein EJA01_15125 [Rhodovulum robiginosum]
MLRRDLLKAATAAMLAGPASAQVQDRQIAGPVAAVYHGFAELKAGVEKGELAALADGTAVRAGMCLYLTDAARTGAAAIVPELPGLVPWPGGEMVEHWGAVGDAAADDSAPIIRALAWFAEAGRPVEWGGGTYRCEKNLDGFARLVHAGRGVIHRGEDSYTISDVHGARNVIHCAPPESAGENDGLTRATPTDYVTAFNFVEAHAGIRPAQRWRVQYISGVYAFKGARRLENFPTTLYPIEFMGQADEFGTPTVIFDGGPHGVPAFKRLRGGAPVNLHFENLKCVNFDQSQGAFQIWYDINVTAVNLHAADCRGMVYAWRNGVVEQHKGVFDNCEGCINFQDVYGAAGDLNGTPGTDEIVFNDCTGIGCVHYTRGTKAYLRGCEFNNVDVGILISRHARCRTQGNRFNSWKAAAIKAEMFAIWNYDRSDLDRMTGATNKKATVLCEPFCVIDRVHKDTSRPNGHMYYYDTPITWSGTSRTALSENQYGSENLTPFRMPAWWLYHTKAKGEGRVEITVPKGDTCLMEITGAGSGAKNVLCDVTLPEGHWLCEFEFTGERPDKPTNRFFVRAFRSNSSDVVTNAGSMAAMNNRANADASNSDIEFRLYGTLRVGTSEASIIRMETDVIL